MQVLTQSGGHRGEKVAVVLEVQVHAATEAQYNEGGEEEGQGGGLAATVGSGAVHAWRSGGGHGQCGRWRERDGA